MPEAAIIIGDGIGNQIMTTPMIQAVSKLGYEIDLFIPHGIITNMFDGWKILRNLFPNRKPAHKYDVAIRTFSAKKIELPEASVKITTPHGGDKGRHEAECAFEAARQLGYKDEILPYHVEVEDKDFGLAKNAIVIHPGCKSQWSLKIYPYFRELIGLLVKEYQVVLVGGAEDPKEEWDSKVTNYIDKLTLKQTAALVKQSNFFISGDSGIMHVACAVGTRGIALFGPTSLVKNSPRFGKITVIQNHELDCVPCYETKKEIIRHWTECSRDKKCLRSISPEDIIKKMKELQ